MPMMVFFFFFVFFFFSFLLFFQFIFAFIGNSSKIEFLRRTIWFLTIEVFLSLPKCWFWLTSLVPYVHYEFFLVLSVLDSSFPLLHGMHPFPSVLLHVVVLGAFWRFYVVVVSIVQDEAIVFSLLVVQFLLVEFSSTLFSTISGNQRSFGNVSWKEDHSLSS